MYNAYILFHRPVPSRKNQDKLVKLKVSDLCPLLALVPILPVIPTSRPDSMHRGLQGCGIAKLSQFHHAFYIANWLPTAMQSRS